MLIGICRRVCFCWHSSGVRRRWRRRRRGTGTGGDAEGCGVCTRGAVHGTYTHAAVPPQTPLVPAHKRLRISRQPVPDLPVSLSAATPSANQLNDPYFKLNLNTI